MIRPGLGPTPVGADLLRVHPELFGQPCHGRRRCRGHVVRQEPGLGAPMSDLEKLQRFLRTDARDVGCDEARAVLHISINLVAADQDVAGCYPGDATHLSACGPVRAVRTSPGSSSRSRTSSGCGRHRGGFRAPGRALGLAAADCPRPHGPHRGRRGTHPVGHQRARSPVPHIPQPGWRRIRRATACGPAPP